MELSTADTEVSTNPNQVSTIYNQLSTISLRWRAFLIDLDAEWEKIADNQSSEMKEKIALGGVEADHGGKEMGGEKEKMTGKKKGGPGEEPPKGLC